MRRLTTGPLPAVALLPAMALLACLALLPGLAGAAATDCDDLMRQVKIAVFDQDWDAVRRSTEEILENHAGCRHAPQAAYLRAQSLDRAASPGPAIIAYGEFLERHCPAAGGSINCDLARVTRMELAGRLFQKTGEPQYSELLLHGLEAAGDAGIFAALTLADLPDKTLRARALPRLLRAYDSGVDDDVRNRICLAVLKIDPSRSPCGETRTGDAATEGPALISVEIFDVRNDKAELRINMPVALAEAVVTSLPPYVLEEMRQQGIDIRLIFQSIRDQAMGTIFEMSTEDRRIRIWLQ